MQEWVPLPSPEDPSNPGTKHMSPALAGRFFLPLSSVQSFSFLVVTDSLQPMDCGTPAFFVHQQLPEFTQTNAH